MAGEKGKLIPKEGVQELVTQIKGYVDNKSKTADVANKLTTSTVGNATTPIYLNNGTPTALRSHTTWNQFNGGKNPTASGVTLNAGAYAGVPSGDSSKPYATFKTTDSKGFTIDDDATTYHRYAITGGKTITIHIDGAEYSYTNPWGDYICIFVILDVRNDADAIVSTSRPYDRVLCSEANTIYEGYGLTKLADGLWLVRKIKYNNTEAGALPEQAKNKLSLYYLAKTASVSGSFSVAGGFSSVASGAYSVVSGRESVASGAYSVASGAYSVASGNSSVASGNYSVASGNSSVASGFSSVASGAYSVVSGRESVASGAYSVASGNYSVASGNYSVASGNYSVASGNSSDASGFSSVASGNYSVASGRSSDASGTYSVASGYSSDASGFSSVASGNYSVASGNYSIASGRYTKASTQDQTVIGRYNKETSSLFIVGNGSSETARSNCFEVGSDGTVYLYKNNEKYRLNMEALINAGLVTKV